MRCKAIMSLVLVGILTNAMYAETPDEEIARLKKENELLELQKKNEELKKGKGSESKKSVNVDKSGAFGFCKGEYANTGCFIGAEVGYAPSVSNYYYATSLSTNTATTFAIPINVILGWQWYLYEHMGLNFKAHIGYASYNSDMNVAPDGMLDYKSSAIHYGLEVSYLYDFVATSQSTFGLNVGIGYEFGTFIGQGWDLPASSGATSDISFNSFTNSAFTTSFGVHYFLNTHHQFWLSYKYKGYSGVEGGTYSDRGITIEYTTAPKSVIAFAYAYKF